MSKKPWTDPPQIPTTKRRLRVRLRAQANALELCDQDRTRLESRVDQLQATCAKYREEEDRIEASRESLLRVINWLRRPWWTRLWLRLRGKAVCR